MGIYEKKLNLSYWYFTTRRFSRDSHLHFFPRKTRFIIFTLN